MLSGEDKKDVSKAMGKALANRVSKATKDGFDGNKKWGNSAVKGHGVNSPAMMEARKGFSAQEREDKATSTMTKRYSQKSKGARMTRSILG